jgi:hypothetical protein
MMRIIASARQGLDCGVAAIYSCDASCPPGPHPTQTPNPPPSSQLTTPPSHYSTPAATHPASPPHLPRPAPPCYAPLLLPT